MSMISMQLQEDGLTAGEVLSSIPHDGPAVVVYVMILLFVGLIWWGNRNSKGADTRD